MTSIRPIVAYRPFNGLDGLALEGQELVAYREGQEASRVKLSSPATLEDLLSSYEPVALFTDLVFCHSEHQSQIITIDYSYVLPDTRQIHGWLTFEGDRYRWWAQWRSLPKSSSVPAPDRPWLHSSEVGKGLEFHLPPALSEHPDPVIVRRLALAIESFIYKIRDGWPVDVPFRFHFDNLFSDLTPMYAGNGPTIVTDRTSPLLNTIARSAVND